MNDPGWRPAPRRTPNAAQTWRAGRESDPEARFCRPRSSPEIRLEGNDGSRETQRDGAAEENRTPVASLARSHTTTVLPPQIRRTNWLWQAPKGPAAAVRRGMGSGLLTDNPRLPAHPVERRGVAPRYLPCKGRVLLLNDRPEHESAEKKPDKERSWEMDLESLRGRGRVPSPVTSGRITQPLRPDGAPDEDRTRLA